MPRYIDEKMVKKNINYQQNVLLWWRILRSPSVNFVSL